MKKIFFLLCAGALSFTMSAQVPKTLNYQGFLTESNVPVSGNRRIIFTILDGSVVKYTETFAAVPVDKGLFSVTLGKASGANLPNDVWTKELTVKIEVGDPAVAIGDPVPLTTVPYAFMSSSVDNTHVQDLMDGTLTGSKVGTGVSASNVTTGTLNGGLVGLGINATNITTGTLANTVLDADLQDLADGSLSGSKVGSGFSASNIAGTIADASLETTVDRTIFNASDYITAVGGLYVGANVDPGDGNMAVTGKVRLDNTPTFTDAYILEVESTGSGAVMKVHKNQAVGTALVDFYRSNTLVGSISEAGGTISYNPFTGSHFGYTKESMEIGTLVSLSGFVKRMNGMEDSEPIYEVNITQSANDSKVLGAFLHNVDQWKDAPLKDVKAIMAVGNGVMWVVEAGQDISVGDYLISSSVKGHAMKDDGSFEVSYVVARAAENVEWRNIASETDGLKHKKISVFFENFTINHSADKMKSEVDALKKEIEHLKRENQKLSNTLFSEIEDIKRILNQPHD